MLSATLIARLARTAVALAVVVVVTFAFVHIVPGSPARAILGPQASPEAVQQLTSSLGLDQPLGEQFADYVSRLARGDLGTSAVNQEPVSDLVVGRIAPTLWLILLAAVIAVAMTLPLALLAAFKQGRPVDHVVRVVPIVVLGLPSFWLALVLIQWLAIDAHIFPPGGYGSSFSEHVQSLVLPAFVTALSILPFTVQSLRAALIEVLESDFVAAARARGVPARTVTTRHVLRNATVPAVVVLGLNMGWLVGSTIVVEKIFAIPGLGSLLIDSILSRDFPVVQGLALVLALLVMAINLATDVARTALDPRLRTA